jgi:FkbM family methyltransferase
MNFQHKKIEICGQPTKFFGYSWDPFYASLNDEWDGNRSLQTYLSEHVADGATILDVGANIGTTSIMMSRAIKDARIVAIEPTPAGFACLKQNIEANQIPNCSVIQAAIGDAIGTTLFHQSTYIAGSHMVSADHPTIHEESHAIRVDLLTIDEVVNREHLRKVDFIKIDVEGFEPAVIRGAAKTIEKFNPVVFVEFNAFTIAAFGEGNPRAFLNQLRATFSAIAYDRAGERVLIRTDMDALGFLNHNMTQAGCVSDLICGKDLSQVAHVRVIRSPQTLPSYSDEELRALSAAHAAERKRAEEFENSLSWRVTKPLRLLSRLMRGPRDTAKMKNDTLTAPPRN